jgi:hypothetical protein
MAIQYSLSYDADGNPSLVKNTVKGSTPVIKQDFNIGAYEPRRNISTDYTFTLDDPFGEESQLQILKTYIAENDSDPKTFTGDVRQRDMLSAMDKDKMSRISKFVGKEAAVNFEKYAKRSATAQELKGVTGTIGLFTSNPLNTILNIGARAVGSYSDKQIDKIMNNMYASENYQNYMRELDYEYDAYQDYDVYNDFSAAPNYRDPSGYLDIRPGTVFDAEDEEDYSTTTTPTSAPAYDFDDSMSNSDNTGGSTGTMDASDFSDDTPGTPF